MDKFTIKQVLDGLDQKHLPAIDNPIKDEWLDFAGDWLINDPNTYLNDGFEGWSDRSPGTILCDFHYNDRLVTPLTDAQIDLCHKGVGVHVASLRQALGL